jgi:uncharacterized membrane protein YesL
MEAEVLWMAGGFFNRLYYGNDKKPDLTKEQVSGSRFKLFFDVLGVRFWKLIQLNLLYLLFCIPIITIGPATAGMTLVLRNWARDDHSWVWSDFWDGMKSNFWQALAVFGIDALAAIILWVNIQFYNAMGQTNQIFFMIKYLVLGIALIFAMMHIYIYPMMVTYKLRLRDMFKNAFIFTAAKLPHTIGIFALCVGLFIASIYLYVLPLFIITFSLCGLIVNSFTNAVFDKYINVHLDDSGHYVPIEDKKTDEEPVTDEKSLEKSGVRA